MRNLNHSEMSAAQRHGGMTWLVIVLVMACGGAGLAANAADRANGETSASTQPCDCDAACATTPPAPPSAATATAQAARPAPFRRLTLPALEASVVSLDVVASEDAVHLLMGTPAPTPRPAPTSPATRRSHDGAMQLHHSVSHDGGVTWSTPARVDAGAPKPMLQHRGDDAHIAPVGDALVAVWTTPGSGAMGSGPLASAISRDGGRTWQAGRDPSLGDQAPSRTAALPASQPVDRHGRRFVAMTAQGSALHLVWLDALDKDRSIRAVRSADGGATWSAEHIIDPKICACCWNTLRAVSAADGGVPGDLFVTYRDIHPSDMGIARSSDGGRTWRSLGHVGRFGWRFDGCPHVGAGLAVAPRIGNPLDVGGRDRLRLFVSLWTGHADRTGAYVLISDDAGLSWREPISIGSPQRARHTDVAALDAQRVLVAWDEIELSDKTVHSSVTHDGGRSWSAPIELSPADAQADHPRVVTAGGRYVVLWTQKGEGDRVTVEGVLIGP